MPYARPTLTQLRDQALQDIQSGGLPGVDGLLQRAVLRVLAYALAGLSYLHYGYQDWIALQAVPWTAEDEYLEGWAALKSVNRKPANVDRAAVHLHRHADDTAAGRNRDNGAQHARFHDER